MLHPLAGIQKHPGGPGSLNDWRDIQVREVWVDDGFSAAADRIFKGAGL